MGDNKDLQVEILNARAALKQLELECTRKRVKLVHAFTDKINGLIAKTPTGELRNELTELNILFISICQNTELF